MAGWYRIGTVNLTNGSATVTGVGATLWASALRPGMVFTTDYSVFYEVKSVDGDAQITLDRAWAGATAAGVAYAVIFGGAAISNAEIVAELMGMVSKWQTREDQYDDWVAGQPDGGPNGDGKYPLTDSKGVTRLVTSPGRLLTLIDDGLLTNVQQVVDMIEDDIAAAQQAADQATAAAQTLTAYVTSADQDRQAAEAARDAALAAKGAAATSESNAKASETAAGNSATTANTAANVATGARDATLTAKTATEQARDVTLAARDVTTGARDATLAARDVTTQARDQATAAQTDAATSRARAQDAMATAVNAAADSVDAKIHAVAAQVVAEQRRNEAADSATLAKAWASNPVGQPVTSGAMSAYHWAEQARTFAQTAQVIAGGYMFGVIGDGNAGRINAQAAADTLHLVAGSGMSVTYDNATRKVVFSSQARAVATEDPAITVRLDDTAALAYLGLDESKISHQALSGAGARSHAEIDTHIANTGIHVPAPGSGDVDKLLKATGAGTFAWVKGAGSGIDADMLDGRSWESGDETGYNGGAAEWIKLGRWDCQGSNGRRMTITCAGADDYSTGSTTATGLTIINATSANNTVSTAGNIVSSWAWLGQQLLSSVKYVQVGTNRFLYDVYVQRLAYSPFNFKVQCGGSWTTAVALAQSDPGADSATVRAAVNLGRMLTTADWSQNADANTVVQRDGAGGFVGTNIMATGNFPGFYWYDSDSSADAKRWGAIANGDVLMFQTINDAWNVSKSWLEVTRSGLTPTVANYKVPVNTQLAALGTATGNTQQFSELYASSGNADYLRTKLVRLANNGDWTSAVWRIQRGVDVDDQGFVQFGLGTPGTFAPGAGLGVTNTMRLWVPGSGDVTIDNNKVWTAGNFDPNSKAGTAVATVAANGLMSAADKATLNGATSAATPGALVQRDWGGGAAFVGVTINGNAALHAGNNGTAWPTLNGVTAGGVVTTNANGMVLKSSTGTTGYGVIHRNDGGSYYILLTNKDDAAGGWNNLRPFRIDLPTGTVVMENGVNTRGGINVTTGHIAFDGLTAGEQRMFFTGSPGGTNVWLGLYANSSTLGAYDWQNNRAVWSYYHQSNEFQVTPHTKFDNGVTIDDGKALVLSGNGSSLSLPNAGGTNAFFGGTGDGASYSTYNYSEMCWNGKGFKDHSGTVHMVQDFRTGSWNVHGQFNTDPNNDGSAMAASFNARKGSMSSGTYNQVLWGENDTGGKVNIFVNGSTRSFDGGPNAVTFRNEGGTLVLGGIGQQTKLYGSSVTVNDNRVMDTSNANAAYRNLVHNARFRIVQRNVGPWTTGGYGPDRWQCSFNGGVGVQHAVINDSANLGYGSNWYEVKITAASAMSGSSGWVAFTHSIEDIDVYPLDWGLATAKPVTVSFDVMTNVAGTYAVCLRNFNSAVTDRSQIRTITVPSGKSSVTLTFPGCTTGQWGGAGVGINMMVTLAATSDVCAPSLNAWNNGNYFGASGQTNLAATVGNYFRIANVRMEPGTVSTPMAAMDLPFAKDLEQCMRFLQWFELDTDTYIQSGFTAKGCYSFQVRMRATPTGLNFTDVSLGNVNAYGVYGSIVGFRWQVWAQNGNQQARALIQGYMSAEI